MQPQDQPLIALTAHFQTFGCSLYQQLIWEMFDHIQAGWSASGDKDQKFLAAVKNASNYVDKGIHVGSWGQLQGKCIFVSLAVAICISPQEYPV
jgi:alpha-L-fucosidase 2